VEGQACIAVFLETLQKLGWAAGRNVQIEYRWGTGDAERAKASAAELIRLAPDAIVVATTPALAELHRMTSTIPIVFIQVGDPVEAGFAASLARPGGNMTGFQAFEPTMMVSSRLSRSRIERASLSSLTTISVSPGFSARRALESS
jgi:putative tryptophan/tyrosine transport system substrate-binding protein